MLRSPTYALIWSLLKRYQWGVITLVLLIPFLFTLKILLSQYFPIDIIQNSKMFHSLILTLVMPFILLIFTMADVSTSNFRQSFPKYTFVHPISSAKLALIPVISGIIFASLFLITWLILIAGNSISLYQYGVLILTISGAMSWLQMISWRLSQSPYLGILISVMLISSIFVIIVSIWDVQSLLPLIPMPFSIICLFALPISGIWLAVNSVKVARTNKATVKRRYLSNIGFIGFNLPKHYRSISHALFRYEWRVFGWILPMAGVFMITLLIFITIDKKFAQEILGIIFLMLFGLVYLPWFLPAEMAKSDLSIASSKPKGLSSFLLSLPISSYSIAMAKLKLASRSIFVFQAMVLIIANIILFTLDSELCKNGINGKITTCFTNPWDWLNQQFGTLNSVLIIISANLIIPIVAWALGGNTLSWCLKGEKFLTVRTTIILIIGVMLIIAFGLRMYSTEAFRALLWSYAPIVNVFVFISIALVFASALKRFQLTNSLKMIKHLIIIAIPLLTLLLFTLYSTGFVTISNPHLMIILLDLSLLGILPILTSPLSIAKNRAR